MLSFSLRTNIITISKLYTKTKKNSILVYIVFAAGIDLITQKENSFMSKKIVNKIQWALLNGIALGPRL
jgi:hypothetical protein